LASPNVSYHKSILDSCARTHPELRATHTLIIRMNDAARGPFLRSTSTSAPTKSGSSRMWATNLQVMYRFRGAKQHGRHNTSPTHHRMIVNCAHADELMSRIELVVQP
jgi:hypothetical protein